MATYVISDIHGEYDKFMQLLKNISFKQEDILYVLGDILDRGPEPIKVILEMMKHSNIYGIAGNHEVMALTCLRFLMQEITEESLEKLDDISDSLEKLEIWSSNGNETTIDAFRQLDREVQKLVYEYISDFTIYEEISIGEQDYLLVHAGLDNFSPKRLLDDYELNELIWGRPDYERVYFSDVILVTGHTPTQLIKENPVPGAVYQKNNHLAIDCGACYGGRLAAVCLETGDCYYS